MKSEDGKTSIEGTVRSLQDKTVRKKDMRKMLGVITIMNEEGSKIVVTSDTSILDGFNPEDNVIVTISRSQLSLGEALKAKRGKKSEKE